MCVKLSQILSILCVLNNSQMKIPRLENKQKFNFAMFEIQLSNHNNAIHFLISKTVFNQYISASLIPSSFFI